MFHRVAVRLQYSAEDWSGNKNHGTINGGVTTTTDRFGNANKAYSFNGSSGYVNTNLMQQNVSNYTISSWIKTNSGGIIIQTRGPIQVGCTTNFSITIRYDSSNYIQFFADGNWVAIGNQISPSNYVDNQWHHIIAKFESISGNQIVPNNFSIYLDRIKITNVTPFSINYNNCQTTYSPISGVIPTKIAYHESTSKYFNGKLDDIRIYNRALNDQEVEALYNESAQPPIVTNQTITIDSVTTTSLKLNWTKALDESTYQSKLQYRAFYSTSNNLDTVKNIEANGTPVGDWMTDASSVTVNNLTANTMYYFNVIVRDGGGNKAGYTQKSQSTNP